MSLWVTPDAELVALEQRRQWAINARVGQYRNAADQARRRQRAEQTPADPTIGRINRWAETAPWLPPGVLLGAAESGLEPDSAVGRMLATHHLATRGLGENWSTPTTGARARTTVSGSPDAWMRTVERMATQPPDDGPDDATVNRQWEDWRAEHGRGFAMVARDTYGWDDTDVANLYAYARDNGLSPETVVRQWQRDRGGETRSVADFITEATKDRPSNWQRIRQGVPGLATFLDARQAVSDQSTARLGQGAAAAAGAAGRHFDAQQELGTRTGPPATQGVDSPDWRAGTRSAFMALDSGMQTVQGAFRRAVTDPLGPLDGSPLDPVVGEGSVLGETDLGISLELVAQGEPLDLGEGAFPNTWDTTSQVGSIRHERELAHGDVGGHTITMGRWLADRVFTPDTRPFDLVSGLVDASVAIANPLDKGLDELWDAQRGFRAVTNWREVIDTAANPLYRQADDILAGRLATTEFAGTGVHAALEDYLRLPGPVRDGFRAGRDGTAPGIWNEMSAAERQLFARWGDDLEEQFPEVVERLPWVSAVDEDVTDPDLLSGGGLRQAMVPGLPRASGTFSQASLDEAAAVRFSAFRNLEPGAIPDLPAHQLRLDEYVRRVGDTTVADTFTPGLVDPVAEHRAAVADAIRRGDVVPSKTLLDHPDLVPPERLREIVTVDAGVIKGAWRPDIDRTQFDAWLDTRTGAGTLAKLAELNDVRTIWRMFDRRIPLSIARQIADIDDPAVLAQLVRRHAGVEIPRLPTTGTLSTHSITPTPRMSFTDQTVDALAGAATPTTWAGRARLATSRLIANLPQSVVDLEDLDSAAVTVERWMVNAARPRVEIDRVIDRIARIEHPEEMFDVILNDLAGSLRETLVEMGVGRDQVNTLTRAWSRKIADDRQFAVREDGADVFIPSVLMPDGTYESAPGPMLASELVNRYIPMPGDPRDIRRALSPWRGILNNPAEQIPEWILMAAQQAVWKPLTLLRPAWAVRVVGEEQIRLAAAGLHSAFRNPFAYFAILQQRRVANSLLDEPLVLLEEHAAAMSQMGGQIGDAGRQLSQGVTRIGGFAKLGRHDEGYTVGWANELVRLANDPLVRHVHNYGVNDETLAWFMTGGGRAYREKMMLARPALGDVDAARDYLSIVADRISRATGRDPELDSILRTGRIPGVSGPERLQTGVRVRLPDSDRLAKVVKVDGDEVSVSYVTDDGLPVDATYRAGDVTVASDRAKLTLSAGDAGLNPRLISYLDSRVDDVGPAYVIGERVRVQRDAVERGRHTIDVLFQWFGSNPTNNFSRSPAFRQLYWQRATELAPYMTADARAAALAQARKERIGRGTITDMQAAFARTPAGELTLAQADELARRGALDGVKRILFDMSERRQFFDVFRLIFPFGDAWAEVVGRWARLAKGNPLIARRLEQGITTGRSEGWFQEGAFGDEVFNYGPASWAFSHIAPVDMEGRLSGLNMIGDVYPGVGFAVQVPASMVWGDMAEREQWLEMIAPYGVADRVQDTFVPPHVRRFLTGFLAEDGWVSWLPREARAGLTEAGSYFGLTDPQRFESMRKDMMDYLVSTGEWPTSTTEEQQALLDEAGRRASIFLMAQGFTQSIVPTTPIADWQIETDIGWASKAQILDEWYEAQNTDFETALDVMLDRYGEDMWLIFQGKTRGVSLNAPITETPLRWVRQHPEVVDRYPNTYGLFAPVAPEAEDIDPQAFERLMRTGGREPLTGQQMLWLAQDRLAWNIYNRERDAFPARLSEEQASYMQAYEEWLFEQYPGWQRNAGTTERADPEQLIREVTMALEHPAIAESAAGVGLQSFLTEWEWAVAEGRQFSSAAIPFGRSAETRHLRDYVRAYAEHTIAEHPDFEPIWRMVFERALIDVDEEVS